ncbi:MAG: DNA primase [Burkholderiales bacterium]|nr:MAG: DNA primase [Burkholderiales bacterium]
MIPQAFIQDLLARVDIVDVVGRSVKLRKSGANFVGLCPFHGEKTPSFSVSPQKQFYHCFGCGAHGTAIGFLMEHGGLGYVDAIEELARSVGVEVPREGAADAERRSPALLALLEQAAHYYRKRLKDAPQAIEYLVGRGLQGTTAARFAIGYAPAQWRGLEAAVADYDAPEMVAAGLVVEGEGGKRYDRFRDRIMFPIRNPRGQVIGFGGRVLGAGEPKYLNSPETPLFSKGRELYGLFEAREPIRREDCVIVVEGYLDVVMLSQHGVGNVVATLGTATTPDHVRKLLRLVERIVFAFDGDAAGRKAAWRALEASLSQTDDTKRIEFLFLPIEHDPDSYVRAFGADGFREALTGALPLSELLVRELAERVDLAVPEGRARLLAEARPMLHALSAPALRLQLVHRLAELAGLGADEVDRYVGGAPQAASAGRRAPPGHGHAPPADAFGDAMHEASHRPPWGGRPDPGTGGTGGAARAPFPSSRRASRASPATKPDLEQRVRWLAARHPALAVRALEAGESPDGATTADALVDASSAGAPPLRSFASADLVDWLRSIAALPPRSTLADVCEALRAQAPSLVQRLEREGAADDWVLGSLSFDEAQVEFDAALAQLRDREVARQIDELVASGMSTVEDRERYQILMAKRRRS